MPRFRDPLYDDMDALRRAVLDAPHEVLLCAGIDLRHAAGESRLKALARGRVEGALANAGLMAVPEVPEDQRAEVYVTQQASPLALLVAAINAPSSRALTKQVLPAVGGSSAGMVRAVATDELRGLLDEMRERLDEIETGESTG